MMRLEMAWPHEISLIDQAKWVALVKKPRTWLTPAFQRRFAVDRVPLPSE